MEKTKCNYIDFVSLCFFILIKNKFKLDSTSIYQYLNKIFIYYNDDVEKHGL